VTFQSIEIELMLIRSSTDASLIRHTLVQMMTGVTCSSCLLQDMSVVQTIVDELGRVVPYLAVLVLNSASAAVVGPSINVH